MEGTDANIKIENLYSEQIIKDEDNNEMYEDIDNKMEIKSEIIKCEQYFPSELIIKDERYDDEGTSSEYDKMLKETSSGDDLSQIFTKSEDFIQHERIHKEKSSSCDVVRIHTGKKFDKFSCVDCGVTFGKRLGLIKHKRVHSAIKPYQCDFCDQSFTQPNSLFQHKQVHTEVVPWYNEETPINDKILKQISKTYSNPVKKIKGKNNLLQNEGKYKEKPLTRDICEEKFDKFSCDDRGATNRVHTKVETSNNEEILNKFSSNSDKKLTKISETFVKNDEKTKAQNDLLQNGRMEEKSFVCDVCDELFTKRQYLIRHRGIHIGEKFGIFSCDDCGFTFGKHVALILHKRIHTEVKPWNNNKTTNFNEFSSSNDQFRKKISKNDKNIKAQSDLIQNGHKENNFVCDVCDEVFNKKQYLIRHKKIHIGEKSGSFSCVDCGITFGKHIGLILHKRVHSVIKPYSCDVCGLGFTQQNSLFLHKQVHTEVESRYNEGNLNEFSLNSDKLNKKISKTYSKRDKTKSSN